jgi:hypothetical protein
MMNAGMYLMYGMSLKILSEYKVFGWDRKNYLPTPAKSGS